MRHGPFGSAQDGRAARATTGTAIAIGINEPPVLLAFALRGCIKTYLLVCGRGILPMIHGLEARATGFDTAGNAKRRRAV